MRIVINFQSGSKMPDLFRPRGPPPPPAAAAARQTPAQRCCPSSLFNIVKVSIDRPLARQIHLPRCAHDDVARLIRNMSAIFRPVIRPFANTYRYLVRTSRMRGSSGIAPSLERDPPRAKERRSASLMMGAAMADMFPPPPPCLRAVATIRARDPGHLLLHPCRRCRSVCSSQPLLSEHALHAKDRSMLTFFHPRS